MLQRVGRPALLSIMATAVCVYIASLTEHGMDETRLELREQLHMPQTSSVSKLSRVRRTLRQLDNRLSDSERRRIGARGRRAGRQPALRQMSSVISRDASKFAEEERQQQHNYDAVVAREEAQNEEYAEEEARYRKIRAHAYMQQYEGFIKRRKHERIFGEDGRVDRHRHTAGAAGGPGQKHYH